MDKRLFDVNIRDIEYHRGAVPVFSGTISCNEGIYEMFVKETGLTATEVEAFNDFYDSILTRPQKFGSAYIEFPAHMGFCVSLGIEKYDYEDFKEIELYKFPKLVQKSFTKEKYDKACNALAKVIKSMKEEIIKVKERMEDEEDMIEQE